jgi:hypothetical protein
MNTKIVVVVLLLVFIALCWAFNADALNQDDRVNDWLSGTPDQNKVIVYFDSDYMGTGRVARAKVSDVQDTGLFLILTDVLGERGALTEWLDASIFFPYSSITSVRRATDKQWNRMKETLKQFN